MHGVPQSAVTRKLMPLNFCKIIGLKKNTRPEIMEVAKNL